MNSTLIYKEFSNLFFMSKKQVVITFKTKPIKLDVKLNKIFKEQEKRRKQKKK